VGQVVEIPAAEGELPAPSDRVNLEAEPAISVTPSETSAAEEAPAGEAGRGQPEIEATVVPITEQAIEPVGVELVEPVAEVEETEQIAEPVAELPTTAQLPPALEEPALEFSEPEWERAEELRLASELEAAQIGTEIPATEIPMAGAEIPQPGETAVPPVPSLETQAAETDVEIVEPAQPAPPIPSVGAEIPTPAVEIVEPAEAERPSPGTAPEIPTPTIEIPELAETVDPLVPSAEAEWETTRATPPASAPAIAQAPESAQMPPYVPPARQRAPEAAADLAPAPPAPAGGEQLTPSARPARRRRDPLGGEHLAKARAHCEANRVEQALPEYDYIVQRAPRLVNEVIQDLEQLVQRGEVPLEAHRILGDAYTRVDRLAEALERYRFVLDRVS
jgi:hypothetical protein